MRFTIFTPTFNRAATLERLYDSIERQTVRDFEWVVVDDGSTDNSWALLTALARRATFPMQVQRQSNGGKHSAFNHGVRLAQGDFFLTIDSDDELLPDAIAVLLEAWEAIPRDRRSGFTGVTARSIDEHGGIVGDPPCRSPLDSDSAEATFVFKMLGERAGFHRTDVLRQYPFPEHLPTRFIPEGRIWLEIAQTFATRFIDAPIRIFHDHGAPRLSALNRGQRALGDRNYYHFALGAYAHWLWRAPIGILKLAVGLRRAELHLGMRHDTSGLNFLARALAALATPAALIAYSMDEWRRDGRIAPWLIIGRVLLRGRGGPRTAAWLGGMARKSAALQPLSIHAAGVPLTVDPLNPGDDVPLYTPIAWDLSRSGTPRISR